MANTNTNAFVPYNLSTASAYSIALSDVQIGWELPGNRPLMKEIVRSTHTIGEMDHPIRMPISMADCQHVEGTGKMWRSIFIATTPSGNTGISITSWGKDHNVKGQTQIKVVSETEWYSVLKSKYDKGYAVVSYVGRAIPLKVGHEFVGQISRDPMISKLPVISAHDIDLTSLSAFALNNGMKAAHTISQIPPMDNIIREAVRKGHNPLAEIVFAVKDQVVEVRDFAEGFTKQFEDILRKGTGSSFTPREPVPQIDREEVYGTGWGAFC